MNLKKDDLDRIFANANTVVSSTHQIADAVVDVFGADANSRRNAYGQPNVPPIYARPAQYGYGYSDGVNYFGGLGIPQPVQAGYPGFYNPAYGNGGMW